MTKRSFTGVQPVRFQPGSGWVTCEESYRAQRWRAVFKGRVLDKPPYQATMQKAFNLLTANALRHAKPARDYKLGRRMEKQA
jgi:hypothetical protein